MYELCERRGLELLFLVGLLGDVDKPQEDKPHLTCCSATVAS